MAKRGGAAGEPIPLSRFGALVAQLESVVASARQKPPDALLCFDLLSELSSALDEAPKETIQLWQRKCEDALQSLLFLGARRPVRRLASSAMGRIIERGDAISVYSRASTLQGWLVDGKRTDPMAYAGVAQCLGEIYRLFGHKITAGLIETSNIVAKLMKYHEDFVRQDALLLLENALEGSGGGGSGAAYLEAFRIIMRGGVKKGVKKQSTSGKKFDDGLQKHLILPFVRANGANAKKLRIGLALSGYYIDLVEKHLRIKENEGAPMLLKRIGTTAAPAERVSDRNGYTPAQGVMHAACGTHMLHVGCVAAGGHCQGYVVQMIHMKYGTPDSELQNYAVQVTEILQGNASPDPHALVPSEFKDILDNTVVAALSHSSAHVRVEAALTLRALAEVDPTCVGGLVSYGITTLHALTETLSFDKKVTRKVM
uniref:Uncharacterized protein n=1 Tax=Oryza sativa subsp. japonica TaxID=39947 RepID=Q654D4_ORYSJ|nr:hypothetical protein [Oryza sativa Japonica Group]